MTTASRPRVALVTYSAKPRGGVVHTLSLAEAMVRRGADVTVVALGDPEAGFFREVAAPYRMLLAPGWLPTLEERVFASVDALEAGLGSMAGDFDIFHTQDCISARAAARVRDAGAPVTVVRTVHHVDDFTTQALIDCQRQAILEPDSLVVVSEHWRQLLRDENGVEATVIHNGVDPTRFGPIPAGVRARVRAAAGADGDRFVFLAIGGIEPRKGSVYLFEAMAKLRAAGKRPVLVVVGGHSFQDYRQYREDALALAARLGLVVGSDIILAGTVTDQELHEWYRSADALVFPSLKEGWGLVVLEAMCAKLPVVASDISVLREYLTDGVDAILTHAADADDLARGMAQMMDDSDLRAALRADGTKLVQRFTWDAAAAAHERLYDSLTKSAITVH